MLRRLVVLGALAACGDGMTIPDAVAPDSDARELVTIEVRSAYVGSGARVIFQDRDSNVLAATRTDAAGRGNAFLPDVTAYVTIELVDRTAGDVRRLYTFPNVRPGDHVALDDGTLVTLTMVNVRAQPHMGASAGYLLSTSCGGSSLEGDVPTPVLLVNCGSSADMLVTWNNDYLYRADVGVFENAAINLTGTYQPFTTTRIRAYDAPPSVFQAEIYQVLLDGARPLYQLPGSAFLFFDGITTEGEANLATPTWPGARALTTVVQRGPDIGAHVTLQWGARGETTEIDLDRDLVRELLTFPRYHPQTSTVSWLERDQGKLADATLVQLGWTYQDDLTFRTVSWRILAERTNTARITLPRLPDPMYQPTFANVEELVSFSSEGGYAHLRELPLLGRWRSFDWNTWIASEGEGRLTYQSLGPNVAGPLPLLP